MALDLEDGDWIPLWRKIRKSWIWADPEDLRAWVDILMMANHGEGVFRFRGNLHPMRRGQVAMTYKALAERNGWSRNRVRTFLARLKAEGALIVSPRTFDSKSNTWTDTKSDTGFLLLTIVNYPLRKGDVENRTPDRTPKRPVKGQRPDSDGTATGHIQEVNNVENEKKGGDDDAAPPPWEGDHADPPGEGTPRTGSEGVPQAPEPAPQPPAAPAPPPAPPAKSGPEQGVDAAFAADLEAFRAFSRPGDPHKLTAFRDLVRQGVKHERIRQAAADWPAWDFYDVVKALQHGRPSPMAPKSNGRPNPTGGNPAPNGSIDRDLKSKAAQLADAKLAELPVDEVAKWRAEVEQEAKAIKVPEFGLKGWVVSALRIRAARRYGIEGL